MDKNDFIEGWTVLRSVYPRLPDLETQINKHNHLVADAWFGQVRKFRREAWLDAVQNCVAHERYSPVPATLREYCFIASRKIQEEEAERQRSLVKDGAECKWCGGGGWIFVEEDGEWPTCFNCVCSASRDAAKGREILDKALADEKWQFNGSDHTFRRKHRWIGEVNAEAVEAAFKQGKVSDLF